MSENVKLSDNPSIETQLYVMGGAINRLLEDNKEIKQSQEEFRLLQREQNGNVSLALNRIGTMERRMDAHDDWHGDEDERTIKRIHAEEVAEARKSGRADGYKTVLGLEYKVLVWVAGSGLSGAILGKLVHMIGWW